MQLNLEFSDLPQCRVRRSARARRPSVTVCMHDGIVLTLPHRFDERRVPALLNEWRPWIDRQLRQFDNHRATLPDEMTAARPAKIHLAALGQTWQVRYRAPTSTRKRIVERAETLEVHAVETAATQTVLRRWLARRARGHLRDELDRLAARHGLAYKKLSIRGQRTRWGSCSSSGTISLNYLLMFLAPAAASAVLLHELCHTRYMSHGPRFYALLEKLEPGYHALDDEVRQGWQAVPAWAWPSG